MQDAAPLSRPGAEDRALFRDSLTGFLAQAWPVEHAVPWGAEPERLREATARLAAQGITTLGTDPGEGGLAEIVIAMEALGAAACRAPVLGAMLLNLLAARGQALPPPIAALQTALHSGEAALCLSLGAQDPDRCAGAVHFEDGFVSGTLRFVEGMACATHLAVAVSAHAFAVIEVDDQGVSFVESPLMDMPGFCGVTLTGATAVVLETGNGALQDLLAFARLAGAARALGAADRAFGLSVAYARERVQFGRPIGSFQAIQHKLANNHIALQAVRLSIANAALRFDCGDGQWRWYGAAATGLAAASLRQVSLETHHAFGAIGYSEEHEAPRHFRSVHIDTLALGGAAPGFEEAASHFLDRGQGFPADAFDAGGGEFRAEVRAWLARHWSGERKQAHDALPFHQREYDAAFARDIGATGWIGLAWPRQFGGQQRSTLEQLAFIEEMERAEAPRFGAPVQATMLQIFGTPAQQARYLPEILRGEAMFGMGYSEPQAGSDLAALTTRAVRDGDHYVIDGQKIWTTTYWGKYMLLATRTDADAQPRHAGLSLFIVPMSTPGITVRTSTTMYGGTFANVFYDKVRVPADARIGAEGDGWKVLTGALATERGLVGGGIVLKVMHLFEGLCGFVRGADDRGRPLRSDPLVRRRIGELGAQIEAARRMMLLCAGALDHGNLDPADAAVSKVYSGELMERFSEAGLDILGLAGALSHGSPGAVLNGRIEQGLRHSLMWVISIGTNEIQRNLIAQRALSLPR